jgi:hypothetical protein
VDTLLGAVGSHCTLENLNDLDIDLVCVPAATAGPAGVGHAMQIIDRTTGGPSLRHLSLSVRLEQLSCDAILPTVEAAVCRTGTKRLTIHFVCEISKVLFTRYNTGFLRKVLSTVDCPHVILHWGNAVLWFLKEMTSIRHPEMSAVAPPLEQRTMEFHLEWDMFGHFFMVLAMSLRVLTSVHTFVGVVRRRESVDDNAIRLFNGLYSLVNAHSSDFTPMLWTSAMRVVRLDVSGCDITSEPFVTLWKGMTQLPYIEEFECDARENPIRCDAFDRIRDVFPTPCIRKVCVHITAREGVPNAVHRWNQSLRTACPLLGEEDGARITPNADCANGCTVDTTEDDLYNQGCVCS